MGINWYDRQRCSFVDFRKQKFAFSLKLYLIAGKKLAKTEEFKQTHCDINLIIMVKMVSGFPQVNTRVGKES
jgi:hypothetical protein